MDQQSLFAAPRPPLAERMRPRTLDEFLGQEQMVGPGTALRRAIEADALSSFILWGPPGCGKTSLARVVAGATKARFVEFSAVTAGIPEVRIMIKEAADLRSRLGERTILFVDEVHRFNKAQQDAFLPHVENGTIILLGATTENPYFEVIAALTSRARVYQMKTLTEDHLRTLAHRALEEEERGLGGTGLAVADDALDFLIRSSNGDARALYNALELAAATLPANGQGARTLDLDGAVDLLQHAVVVYDKSGDTHHDVVSAFIKSMRGGDPDAALYWLARMLQAGEDPKFIARRMVIAAAEDVGNADPVALQVAVNAAFAVDFVGLPEARIPLAQAAAYIASAPKSNAAYLGIQKALQAVEQKTLGAVPLHLRNAAFSGAGALGYGQDYQYGHDFSGHFVFQQYLPDNLLGEIYYQPSGEGEEAAIRARLAAWWPVKRGSGI